MSITVLLLEILLVVVTALFDDAGARNGAHPIDSHKLVMIAKTDKKIYSEDNAILLSAEFKNNETDPVTIWCRGIWPNHRISVQNEKGQDADLTQEGVMVKGTYDDRKNGSDKSFPVVINSGRTYWSVNDIDLRKYFKLPKGRYKIKVRYADEHKPTPRDLESDAISIRVD